MDESEQGVRFFHASYVLMTGKLVDDDNEAPRIDKERKERRRLDPRACNR